MTDPRLPCSTPGAVELPLDAVAPDPGQPRSPSSMAELAELAESLRVHRLIQPIVVTPHPEAAARSVTPYMILVGERRWRAAKLAGLATVPAVVRRDEITASDRLLLQIAENDERSPLGLLERARAYQRAHQLSRLSQQAFAERCRKTKGLMSQLLHLADAQGLLRQALEEGLLNDHKTARLFERLAVEAQQALLAAARLTGQPITAWRLQAAKDSGRPEEGGEAAARTPADRSPGAAAAAQRAPAPVKTIDIPFTYDMLRENLRFLGAKALPTLEAAADQLLELLAAGGAA